MESLNVLYKSEADEYARLLASRLGGSLHSVVLFGSVARREAIMGSDIDLLVVGEKREDQDVAFNVAYDLMERSRFERFLSIVYFTRPELERLVQLRTSFISDVLQSGVVIFDDGTSSKLSRTVSPGR
jgi:predicted nucleotidyltransferase